MFKGLKKSSLNEKQVILPDTIKKKQKRTFRVRKSVSFTLNISIHVLSTLTLANYSSLNRVCFRLPDSLLINTKHVFMT